MPHAPRLSLNMCACAWRLYTSPAGASARSESRALIPSSSATSADEGVRAATARLIILLGPSAPTIGGGLRRTLFFSHRLGVAVDEGVGESVWGGVVDVSLPPEDWVEEGGAVDEVSPPL